MKLEIEARVAQVRVKRRCAISFCYDPEGIVDDYIVYLLEQLRPYCEMIIFVVNGLLGDDSRQRVARIVDHIIVRRNEGYDVHAYKAGLEFVWETFPAAFDEILMFNNTFYGPLYPLSELFDTIDVRACDFWGITAHKKVIETTNDGPRHVPYHLNSHFIAVREPMLSSVEFVDYWRTMRQIDSYQDAIDHHELRFTKHFQDNGYVVSSYIDSERFDTAYPAFMEIDRMVIARCPLLKRRPFFHDSVFINERAVDLPRALRIIEANTDYDTSLIWRNIVRSTPARVLSTNTARLRILPDIRIVGASSLSKRPRIALCVHAYYVELMDEILEFAENIPVEYDLIVTTDTLAKKANIEATAGKLRGIGEIIVRISAQRGRDMSALFVTCSDLFSDDRYNLVCRVHTKKSPQVDASLGNFFKRFVLENTLGGVGYVEHILDLFARDGTLGVAMPPMIHISTPTLGHAWFINRQNTVDLAKRLRMSVPLDGNSPIAVYGGMFWFRPKALRKLFSAGFTYEDFESEPLATDGTLGHALERIIAYVAHDAGYSCMAISLPHHLEFAYTMLEFKVDELAMRLPTGDLRRQIQILDRCQEALRTAHCDDVDFGREQGTKKSQSVTDLAKKLDIAEARGQHLFRRLRLMMVPEQVGSAGQEKHRVIDTGGIAPQLRLELNTVFHFLETIAQISGGRFRCPDDVSIIDYITSGYLEQRDIFPLFDSAFYMEQYPDVESAGYNPFVHFLLHGCIEGRSPHPLIDLKFIRSVYPGLMNRYHVSLAEFADSNVNKRFSPHPLFDTAYYLQQVDASKLDGMSPVEHYLREGLEGNVNTHPLFDNSFYLAHSPELKEFGVNPLVHYVRYGGLEGRKPSPDFDGAEYLRRYPDVLNARRNPLIHYVLHGQFEGRSTGVRA